MRSGPLVSRILRLLAASLVAAALVSCAARPAVSIAAPSAHEQADAVSSRSSDATYAGGKDGANTSEAAAERMIVQTVSMTLVVENTDTALDNISRIVAETKGYIAESSRWLSNDQAYARVVFRVPAASLDAVTSELRRSAIRVDNQTTRGEDVTEEYVDLEARLRNLEATETELLALMTEVRENRGKAEDILAIHRELTAIREQIESLKGRQQYLARMSAMATFNVEIRPKEAPRQVVVKAQWSPLVTLSRALRGFVAFLQVFADLLLYVLVFAPFVLVPVAVIWFLSRKVRAARTKRSQRSLANGEAKGKGPDGI